MSKILTEVIPIISREKLICVANGKNKERKEKVYE